MVRGRLLAMKGLRWSLAVFVNTLLNLIDAIAIGQLIFPRTDAFFQRFTVDAICLYLVATAASQLLYPALTSYGSAVTAGMMGESLPFLHAMLMTIKKGFLQKHSVEDVDLELMMPTILSALVIHALSIASFFFILYAFKLGDLVRRFPKYVLLGAMGGIGLFLVKTALEQAGPRHFLLILCGICPAISVVFVKRRLSNPFIVPVTVISLIFMFYIWSWITGMSWSELREGNLLIPGPSSRVPPFRIYMYWSLASTDWSLIFRVFPTILASSVFAMLHLPINAPSFARSSQQGFRMNRELLANGCINLLTAACGLLPSYFIYTASVLFIQAGADSKVCGYILGLATGASTIFALPYIRFIPTVAVLFLLFYLGLELLTEAIIDGWELTTRREYSIVVIMMVSMMGLGFAQGLLLGVLVAASSTLYDIYQLRAQRLDAQPMIMTNRNWAAVNVYSPAENAFLDALQSDIVIAQLEGYYHFFNTELVLDQLRASIRHAQGRFTVLDLSKALRLDLNMIESLKALFLSNSTQDPQAVVLVSSSRRLVKLEAKCQGRIKVLPKLCDAIGWINRLQLMDLTLEQLDDTRTKTPETISESASLLSLESGESKSQARRSNRLERARGRYLRVLQQETALLELIKSESLIDIQTGVALWHPGEKLEGVYIVEYGCIEEYSPLALEPTRRFHRGAWIGLEHVLNGDITLTTCIASMASRVRMIPADELALIPRSRLDVALPA